LTQRRLTVASVGRILSYYALFAHTGVLPFSLGKTQSAGLVFGETERQALRSGMALSGMATVRILWNVFGELMTPCKLVVQP
jgi:hypothetical protein